MSWISLLDATSLDEHTQRAAWHAGLWAMHVHVAPGQHGDEGGARMSNGVGLGSAAAAGEAAWVSPMRPRTHDVPASEEDRAERARGRVVRIPDTLVRRMARRAAETGRSEDAIWSEAARLWLGLHDDEAGTTTPPTTAAPAPILPRPASERTRRAWHEIDRLVADLRGGAVSYRPSTPDPAA